MISAHDMKWMFIMLIAVSAAAGAAVVGLAWILAALLT